MGNKFYLDIEGIIIAFVPDHSMYDTFHLYLFEDRIEQEFIGTWDNWDDIPFDLLRPIERMTALEEHIRTRLTP